MLRSTNCHPAVAQLEGMSACGGRGTGPSGVGVGFGKDAFAEVDGANHLAHGGEFAGKEESGRYT